MDVNFILIGTILVIITLLMVIIMMAMIPLKYLEIICYYCPYLKIGSAWQLIYVAVWHR